MSAVVEVTLTLLILTIIMILTIKAVGKEPLTWQTVHQYAIMK
jgi:hypothetical protein